MSEKEYEIKFNDDDTATIREKKKYDPPNKRKRTNPNPTKRELIGYRVRGMNRAKKLILTLCFDIYGIIHRWSCNRGWVCYLSVFLLVWQIYVLLNLVNIIPSIISTNILTNMIPWGIDIICVALFGDIKLFSHKIYKDYRG